MIRRPEWDGRTVVCIASGPSLTQDDCELVRASGYPVVVTNTTFRLCPWADVLFAHDLKWWKRYHAEVRETFKGRRFGGSMACENYGANPSAGLWFRVFTNSGASAISLALGAGASKVVLLGYDASLGAEGKTHWHGDHPKELGNIESIADWPRQFSLVAKDAKTLGAMVVNASRRTALTCFEINELREALAAER